MMKFAVLAAALLTLPATTLAASDKINGLFEQEKQQLKHATKVYFPSLELADKAAISFHNQLLATDKAGGFHIMLLDEADRAKLSTFGFRFAPATQWVANEQRRINALQKKITQQDPQQQSLRSPDTILGYSCYSTVEGTFKKAEQLSVDYSNLAKWVDIGDSWQKVTNETEGYDIKVLQMTNSAVAGDKPILFIHSAMHAREYTTAELTLRFAEYLLQNYGKNADATWILDHHQVHVLFHLNPDGRKQAELGLSWRKNTNENYCGPISSSRGADLNRNFSFFWNAADGSSGEECASTFRGPHAASEPEVQAIEAYIRSIFADNRGPGNNDAAPLDTTGMHIDVHSYSQLVLWPWGHSYEPAPNATELTTLGRKLAYFNGYKPQQSIGLYPTDGTSDDVSYGELGVPAFTFELGTTFFQSCSTFEQTILPDNLQALIYAAKVVGAPYRLPAGPEAVDVNLNGHNTVKVSAGAEVTLSATLNDGRYQNSNGSEPQQNIAKAFYYFDKAPFVDGADGIAMTSSDGTLDSAEEGFSATIDTKDLADGSYLIYVQGQDVAGNWGAVSAAYLHVGEFNQPPQADFSAECVGVRCLFNASGSQDSDGSVAHYRWVLGDGTVKEGADLALLEYVYGANGNYEVKLTVTDDTGQTADKQSNVSVQNLLPTAEFSISCTHNDCMFNANGSADSDGSIVAYQWQLSDGTTAESSALSHQFAAAGTYEVELTVTDDLGATASKSTQVTVTVPQPEPQSTASGGGGGSFGIAALLLGLLGFGRRFR